MQSYGFLFFTLCFHVFCHAIVINMSFFDTKVPVVFSYFWDTGGGKDPSIKEMPTFDEEFGNLLW